MKEQLFEQMLLTSKFLQKLPWQEIDGNALCFVQEDGKTDDSVLASDYVKSRTRTSSLITIVGDAEISGLIKETREGCVPVYILSKAKSIGRYYFDILINGDTANSRHQFDGLKKLVTPANTVGLKPSIKEGMSELVEEDFDFVLMRFVDQQMIIKDPSLRDAVSTNGEVLTYMDIPVYTCDWIKPEYVAYNLWQKALLWVSKTKLGRKYINLKPNETMAYAGRFGEHGLAGLMSKNSPLVEYIGPCQNKDAHIYRVKAYLGLALFDENALRCAKFKLGGKQMVVG